MESLKIFQKGFNYSEDGPGNRLVYHLCGCNFACKWCSNPEGMVATNYKEYSVDELFDEILSAKTMFFSGGGVTFTGGEATVQHTPLLKLLIKLKAADINTAIETNGSSERLFELLPYIDHLIMDFKHYDNEINKAWIGASNESTVRNFIRLQETAREFLIRIPIINGFNNSPYGFVDFFTKYNTSKVSFELLPYHEYGKEKWKKPYEIKNGFISKEDLSLFEMVFTENNLKLIHT